MDEIVSQALVIVGAGAETSASILTAVTGFLLDNPDKLARLAREVRSAFASESEINFDAVAKLPYLVACLDEALRLFPQTGAPSLRVAERDTMICGVKVPQKVSLFLACIQRRCSGTAM